MWIYCVNTSTSLASSSEPPSGSSTETPFFTPAQQQWIQQLISSHSSVVNESVGTVSFDGTPITSMSMSITSAGAPGNVGKWPCMLASNYYSWLCHPRISLELKKTNFFTYVLDLPSSRVTYTRSGIMPTTLPPASHYSNVQLSVIMDSLIFVEVCIVAVASVLTSGMRGYVCIPNVKHAVLLLLICCYPECEVCNIATHSYP